MLLSLHQIRKFYGPQPLFDELDLHLRDDVPGSRIPTVASGRRAAGGVISWRGQGGADVLADIAQWEALLSKPRAAGLPKPKIERPARKRGLTYLEKREIEGMEAAILATEQRSNDARSAFEDPAIATDAARLQACHDDLRRAESEVERLYTRWAELDAKQKG